MFTRVAGARDPPGRGGTYGPPRTRTLSTVFGDQVSPHTSLRAMSGLPNIYIKNTVKAMRGKSRQFASFERWNSNVKVES